jgi:hypothetical protein
VGEGRGGGVNHRAGPSVFQVRELATALALDGKRVKVCVQQAMGTGVFQVCPPFITETNRAQLSYFTCRLGYS